MEAGTALLVGVRAGGMARATAIDARGEATALWQVLGGWGPMAAVDVTGTIAPMLIVEGFSGAGIGGAWDVSDRVRLGVGLLGGVWSHGWRFDDVDAGLAFDPAAIAPAWIDVRVAPAVSLSLAVQAGALGRERTHLISGVDAWSRGPFFLAITGGLTLDIPPSTPPLEN